MIRLRIALCVLAALSLGWLTLAGRPQEPPAPDKDKPA